MIEKKKYIQNIKQNMPLEKKKNIKEFYQSLNHKSLDQLERHQNVYFEKSPSVERFMNRSIEQQEKDEAKK